MKFIHDLKAKLEKNKAVVKLKSIKNIELVIAAVLAIIAIASYFLITAKSKASATTTAEIEMSAQEARIAEMISEVDGVGRSRVLITKDSEDQVLGVVVVAEGTDNMDNRVKVIRLVQKATGVSVDRIEIFEMVKGG